MRGHVADVRSRVEMGRLRLLLSPVRTGNLEQRRRRTLAPGGTVTVTT